MQLLGLDDRGRVRADRDALCGGAQELPHVAGLVGLVQVVDAWQVKAPGELPAQAAAIRSSKPDGCQRPGAPGDQLAASGCPGMLPGLANQAAGGAPLRSMPYQHSHRVLGMSVPDSPRPSRFQPRSNRRSGRVWQRPSPAPISRAHLPRKTRTRCQEPDRQPAPLGHPQCVRLGRFRQSGCRHDMLGTSAQGTPNPKPPTSNPQPQAPGPCTPPVVPIDRVQGTPDPNHQTPGP